MADNDNEGHSGFTVNQIASSSTNAAALPARPNVRLPAQINEKNID
jgi:hypothetical protein